MIGTSPGSGEYIVADDGKDNESTRGVRGGFGAASLRDALRAVAGLREPTTRPTEEVAPPEAAATPAEPFVVEPHPQPTPAPQAETAQVDVAQANVVPPAAPQVTQPIADAAPFDLQPSTLVPEMSVPPVPEPEIEAMAVEQVSMPEPTPQPQAVPREMQSGGQTMLLRPNEQNVEPIQPVGETPAPAPVEAAPVTAAPVESTVEPVALAAAPAISQNSVDPEPVAPLPVEEAVVQDVASEIPGGLAMNSIGTDDNKTRMVRGVQKPGRDDYYQEPVVAWLVVIGGPGLGAFRPVYEGNNALGRAQTQRISIDFGDDAISAEEQAYIRYDSTDRSFLFVPNLAKTNVVSLNESKPTSAVPLSPMDVVTVGQTQLVFVPFCGPDFDWSELRNISSGA